MPRLTIAVEERDHYALKLLAIRRHKRMAAVVDEAIKFYLEHSNAYDLDIRSGKESIELRFPPDD